jgi:hypothetical protein
MVYPSRTAFAAAPGCQLVWSFFAFGPVAVHLSMAALALRRVARILRGFFFCLGQSRGIHPGSIEAAPYEFCSSVVLFGPVTPHSFRAQAAPGRIEF